MAVEDRYINTVTDVNTTATEITIFTEYQESNEWILATSYWDDEGLWVDDEVWND